VLLLSSLGLKKFGKKNRFSKLEIVIIIEIEIFVQIKSFFFLENCDKSGHGGRQEGGRLGSLGGGRRVRGVSDCR